MVLVPPNTIKATPMEKLHHAPTLAKQSHPFPRVTIFHGASRSFTPRGVVTHSALHTTPPIPTKNVTANLQDESIYHPLITLPLSHQVGFGVKALTNTDGATWKIPLVTHAHHHYCCVRVLCIVFFLLKRNENPTDPTSPSPNPTPTENVKVPFR